MEMYEIPVQVSVNFILILTVSVFINFVIPLGYQKLAVIREKL